jgi:hypothetical protein
VALFRGKGAVDPIAIDLAGPEARHKNMPIVKGPVPLRIEGDRLGRRGVIHPIEQEQFNGSAVLGIDRKIDTGGADRSAQGVTLTRQWL